jgi:hypothetical protein
VEVATAGTPSARGGTISVPGGWEQASDEVTRLLDARRFKGVKLSTPVSAWLREAQKGDVSKRVGRNKMKTN